MTVPYNSSQQYREPEDYSYGRGAPHGEEDIPALRDPSYEMPKVLPDSPPSRRPPEVKSKPSVNAVKYDFINILCIMSPYYFKISLHLLFSNNGIYNYCEYNIYFILQNLIL